ncbi:hypothetical protein [Jeotgalibacillus proteolyticus]|uniref:hypothetical protein n=1 Tax=Jeotgalibacillus proteolyticus TaxID=2082395 RepID=UPI001FD650DD|nr:hypothetical protein [Jeotgalibacillus proteolyticus]
MLKKGDKVVMHTCIEAKDPNNLGKIWTCRTDEQEVTWTGSNVVWLEGFSGAFSAQYLQKVDTNETETYKQMFLDLHSKLQSTVINEVYNDDLDVNEHEFNVDQLKEIALDHYHG